MIITNITRIGDPFVLTENGRYYLYATSAENCFKYYSSDDLTVWKDEGYCYFGDSWGENCFWAPEVYKRNGKFYLLYTARWKKNHSLRTGLAVADSPSGPFKDIKNGPLFDFGYATIDATFLFDGDENYIYFVKDCSENIINGVHTSVIYGAKISDDLTEFLSEPKELAKPCEKWERAVNPKWCWNEGPAVIKTSGGYYMNFSVNCFDNRNYCVGCAKSDSPLGPFVKYKNNPILKYVENKISGPGHNSFFFTTDGKLMTAFHIHTDYDRPSGDRRACFAPVIFTEDGDMKIDIDLR